jgi:hypothetical protein
LPVRRAGDAPQSRRSARHDRATREQREYEHEAGLIQVDIQCGEQRRPEQQTRGR